MLSSDYLSTYISQTFPKLVKILSKPPESQDFPTTNPKLSKKLLKLSLALNPPTIQSIFASLISPSLPAERLTQAFIFELFPKSFNSTSSEQIQDCQFLKSKTNKILETSSINDHLLAEIQKLQTENEGFKRLLEDCNYFLNSLKENSPDLSEESCEMLKSLKSSLASKSTTVSKQRSFEKTNLLINSNEESDVYSNLAGFLLYERAKVNKLKTLGYITDAQLAQIETQLLLTPYEKSPTMISIPNTLQLLSSNIESFQSETIQKLKSLNSSLSNLQIQISDYKYSQESKPEQKDLKLCQKYLKKVISDKEQLQDFYEDLKSEKKNLEIRFLKNTINLENQLKTKTAELNTKHEKVQQLESKLESLQNLTINSQNTGIHSQLEQLLITKVSLQGEISVLESQNVKMRSVLESEEQKSKSFSIELDSGKNFRLSDLSDKQVIGKDKEIQELKDALRTISDRYEQDKENLLRDLEESRQDMEVQIFRLRQEKAYQESVCKDLQKHLQELSKEKEVAEKELAWLRQICERQTKSVKSSKFDNEVVSSFEFEISKSIEVPDGPNTLPYKTIQDAILEELNEISIDLKKKRKIDLNNVTIFELIKNTLAHMIKIQDAIESETSSSNNYRETSRNLSDVLSKLKLKIRNIEEESIILNKKLDQCEFDRVLTEPSGKLSNKEHKELLQYYKKQLQIEKAKVLEKKHVIKLHKEQISFLKQNVREIQFELGKMKVVDFEYIKNIYKSFIKEIPILQNRLEAIAELLGKLLGFSEAEQVAVRDQRSSKNGKTVFS